MKIHEQLEHLDMLTKQYAERSKNKPIDLNPSNSANPEPRIAKKKAKRKPRQM